MVQRGWYWTKFGTRILILFVRIVIFSKEISLDERTNWIQKVMDYPEQFPELEYLIDSNFNVKIRRIEVVEEFISSSKDTNYHYSMKDTELLVNVINSVEYCNMKCIFGQVEFLRSECPDWKEVDYVIGVSRVIDQIHGKIIFEQSDLIRVSKFLLDRCNLEETFRKTNMKFVIDHCLGTSENDTVFLELNSELAWEIMKELKDRKLILYALSILKMLSNNWKMIF
jgi:hypothetical protein